jgi:hypothetical protein
MERGDPILALRRVEPELLDDLAADEPQALRARRDLRRVNAVMLQPGIMRGLLLRHAPAPPRRLVDLGGGDGRFMLDVARGLARHWPAVSVRVVDRQATLDGRTRAGFRTLGWQVEAVQADAGEFLAASPPAGADAVVANLFLHHFDDEHLQGLLAEAARLAPLFVACEPRRGRIPLLGSRLLWAVGCGAVTRYDAPVSVRAGFRAAELSQLWPRGGWRLHEASARLFTHTFAAVRERA